MTGSWLPWMSPSQAAHIERLLTRPESIDVFEWGSGGSTLHFTKILHRRGIDFRWIAAEYNRQWHRKVVAALKQTPFADRVEVLLFPVGNDRLLQRNTPMDEYVAAARNTGRRFDLILVDGRKRRRCLLEASRLLKPGGRAVLHDASRRHYRCATKPFVHGRYVEPDLWIGRMNA